jgi:hypothetical protein
MARHVPHDGIALPRGVQRLLAVVLALSSILGPLVVLLLVIEAIR